MEHNESVRHQMPSTETMRKYHGEIERMVFSAEIYCKKHDGKAMCKGDIPDCSFKSHGCCNIAMLRAVIGDHPKGDDI
jgi:hypothetical protein